MLNLLIVTIWLLLIQFINCETDENVFRVRINEFTKVRARADKNSGLIRNLNGNGLLVICSDMKMIDGVQAFKLAGGSSTGWIMNSYDNIDLIETPPLVSSSSSSSMNNHNSTNIASFSAITTLILDTTTSFVESFSTTKNSSSIKVNTNINTNTYSNSNGYTNPLPSNKESIPLYKESIP